MRSFLCCPTRTRTQTDRTRICSATITPLDNLSSDENHVPMLRVQRYLNFHSKQMFVEKKQRIEKTSYDIFHGVMMSYDIRGLVCLSVLFGAFLGLLPLVCLLLLLHVL